MARALSIHRSMQARLDHDRISIAGASTPETTEAWWLVCQPSASIATAVPMRAGAHALSSILRMPSPSRDRGLDSTICRSAFRHPSSSFIDHRPQFRRAHCSQRMSPSDGDETELVRLRCRILSARERLMAPR